MPDLLEHGAQWLDDQRHAHLARPVIYVRGSDTATVDATIGRTEFEQVDEQAGGIINRIESRDFIIRTTDLVLAGVQTLPQSGDQVRETEGEKTFVYEVMSPLGGSEPAFRYSDPYRKALRIHTKHIATEVTVP